MTAPDLPAKRLGNRIFQIRFSMLMLIIVGVAGICAAGRYHLANREINQSMLTQQLHALASGDPTDRRDAARLLEGVSPAELDRVAPGFILAMSDPDASVRESAARSLATSVSRYHDLTRGDIPPHRDAAVRSLIVALDDPDARVRAAAAWSLGLLAVTSPKSGKTNLLGLDPKDAIIALHRALNDGSSDVAGAACQTLASRLAVDPETILPSIVRLASEGSSGSRSYAILLLAKVGRKKNEPPDDILAFLDDKDDHVRKAAGRALTPPWRDPDRVALRLARLLDSCEPLERMNIVVALSTIRPLPDGAIPAVLRAMGSENLDVQDRFERQNILHYTAIAIGNASAESARTAIPSLVNAAKRQARESGSTTALTTIVAIDPKHPAIEELVSPLLAVIKDKTTLGRDRVSLFQTLQMLGPDHAVAAFDALRETLADDYDPSVHPQLCGIFANMGEAARAALPDLQRIAIQGFDSGRFDMSAPAALFAIDPDSRETRDYVLHVAGRITDETYGPSRKFAINYLHSLNANHLSLTGRLIMIRDGEGSDEEKKQAGYGLEAIDELLKTP